MHLFRWGETIFKYLFPLFYSLIDEEQAYNGDDSDEFNWTRYYELEDIYKFLDKILAKYLTVTEPFTIAQSYEGRPVRGIKISYKTGNPGIYIESNIHAREWITSATATWFINELLTSSDPDIRNLAENYDWYIVPVLNVDGFVYTHNKVWYIFGNFLMVQMLSALNLGSFVA